MVFVRAFDHFVQCSPVARLIVHGLVAVQKELYDICESSERSDENRILGVRRAYSVWIGTEVEKNLSDLGQSVITRVLEIGVFPVVTVEVMRFLVGQMRDKGFRVIRVKVHEHVVVL